MDASIKVAPSRRYASFDLHPQPKSAWLSRVCVSGKAVSRPILCCVLAALTTESFRLLRQLRLQWKIAAYYLEDEIACWAFVHKPLVLCCVRAQKLPGQRRSHAAVSSGPQAGAIPTNHSSNPTSACSFAVHVATWCSARCDQHVTCCEAFAARPEDLKRTHCGCSRASASAATSSRSGAHAPRFGRNAGRCKLRCRNEKTR